MQSLRRPAHRVRRIEPVNLQVGEAGVHLMCNSVLVRSIRMSGASDRLSWATVTDPPAQFHVLLEGTLRPAVASTCSLVIDGAMRIVIDPGLSPSQAAITDPVRALGLSPADITDVVISHHHPDHALNVALFPAARVHDHWAIYDFAGSWESVDAEGRQVSSNVHLMRTPGHSAQDISTIVRTADGVVVFSHAWWTADGPADDPYAPDPDVLHASRARILALADLIVPGHGPAFRPSETTAR
jgi:glyoxylase-like metal-dependent hydrolase (beta-lactamase superfamily II)